MASKKPELVKPSYPPINWLMAAILERKKVMGLSWDDIADKVGMSSFMLRRMAATKDPEEWPLYTIKQICKVLRIEYRSYVVGSPEDEHANDQ